MEVECYMAFEVPSEKEKVLIWSLLDSKNNLKNKDGFVEAAVKANPVSGRSLSENLLLFVPFDEVRGVVFVHKNNKLLVVFNYFGSALSEIKYHKILSFIDELFSEVKTRATITFDGKLEHDIIIVNGEMKITETIDFK